MVNRGLIQIRLMEDGIFYASKWINDFNFTKFELLNCCWFSFGLRSLLLSLFIISIVYNLSLKCYEKIIEKNYNSKFLA